MAKTAKQAPADNQQSKLVSKLTWLPKKTFELEITIPWVDVESGYQKTLSHAASHATIKGFREGKAPKQMVEKQIGKEKLYEETIQDLVSHAYFESVKQHNLQPVLNPQITPVKMQENEDWIVKATACEVPEVKLGNYQEAIKSLKAKNAIWTPEKAAAEETESKDKKAGVTMDQILEELLKTSTVELCDMLLDSETNRLLSQLVDQINSVGITVEQYMASKSKTQEQLKDEYKESAEKNLKLEFIILKIAEENKVSVTQQEIEDLISKNQDPYFKKAMENPEQIGYLSMIIRKQKTFDLLKSL